MGYSLAKRRAMVEPVPEPTPAMTAKALVVIVVIYGGLKLGEGDVYLVI